MSKPAGPSPQMGALDHLMHRGEANPRTRSGVLLVEILDRTPDWTRLLDTFERASRVVPRLRQKAVVPSLPTASPRWVIDPDFDLRYHLRRVRAPEPGDLRTVLDMAEVIVSSPLDVGRPLWTVTLVEDLAGGEAALLSHFSHAVTDGVGGVEMFMHLYDNERNPALQPMPPLPVPEDLTPTDLTRSGIYRLPENLIGGVVGAVAGATRIAANLVRDPISTVGGAVDYARSSTRVLGPPAEQSPLLRRRGLSRRIEVLDVPLNRLRKAAKAGQASMNDAYLASLCAALRIYHEELGVPVLALPMAIPVSLRTAADPSGGNQFTGVMLSAPISVTDPVERMANLRKQVRTRRDEPAATLINSIAPVVSFLPQPIVDAVSESVTSADVQASNVPGQVEDTYIAGAKVKRLYGVGPVPGVAMMVVLTTRSGICTVTVRYDTDSVTDQDLFAKCLRAGFDEVLALAPDDPQKADAGSDDSKAVAR
ncbi:MAG TPA: wax ester/triacylglycerol synthase family O-acyltransferase [Aldersonia sp.]